MRRLVALATLFVLTLSRFGAAAPVHVHAPAWSTDHVSQELLTPSPTVRLATLAQRDLASRAAPRSPAPWTMPCAAASFALALPLGPRASGYGASAQRPDAGWHRFTYDATAPPHLS